MGHGKNPSAPVGASTTRFARVRSPPRGRNWDADLISGIELEGEMNKDFSSRDILTAIVLVGCNVGARHVSPLHCHHESRQRIVTRVVVVFIPKGWIRVDIIGFVLQVVLVTNNVFIIIVLPDAGGV